MDIGASYYPEILPPGQWARDLAAGRDIGLTVLRCGEFAWHALEPTDGDFRFDGALRFLDLAADMGYGVVWCTPSATPPPRFFRRWPDLFAVAATGETMPVGVRRNYTPAHPAYRDRCADMARRLAGALAPHPAVKGWQVDNELAGDGFCCWNNGWTRTAFQAYLRETFGSLERFNQAVGGGVWSETYDAWDDIPVPGPERMEAYPPGLRLEFRRYHSDIWRRFYRAQYDALRAGGATQPITTNFYDLAWDTPFDLFTWRADLDAVGLSHYVEEDHASRFQLAVSRAAAGGKPLWVLEQKAGQQRAQNAWPDDPARFAAHLRRCRDAGASCAVYWHLRQHTHGCEMEHGALLGHDGRIGRVGRQVQRALAVLAADAPAAPSENTGPSIALLFDFHQQWAMEKRPAHDRRDYRTTLQDDYFPALRKLDADARIAGPDDLDALDAGPGQWIVAPHAQLDRGLDAVLFAKAAAGSTVVVTADHGRLDAYNAVQPRPLLDALRPTLDVPDVEMLHLDPGQPFVTADGRRARTFHVVPFGQFDPVDSEGRTMPSHWTFPHGAGRIAVLLGAFDATDLHAILQTLRS